MKAIIDPLLPKIVPESVQARTRRLCPTFGFYMSAALTTLPSYGEYDYPRDADRNLFKGRQATHGAMTIAGEGGEVLEHFKKWHYQDRPISPEKVLDECGDVLWGLAITLDALGYTLEDCAAFNIEKLANRYPDRVRMAQESL